MERALIRQEISKACKRLALTQQVVTMCELEATPRQEEFLYQVLSQELAYRERLRRERLLKRAAFPVRKTLDDYEWTALRLPAALPASSTAKTATTAFPSAGLMRFPASTTLKSSARPAMA